MLRIGTPIVGFDWTEGARIDRTARRSLLTLTSSPQRVATGVKGGDDRNGAYDDVPD
jgi:hypothetical protein